MVRRTYGSFLPLIGLVAVMLVGLAVGTPVEAQENRALTAADYDRAVTFLGPDLAGDVIGGSAEAHWLAGDRFWYRSETASGHAFMLVDPRRKSKRPAFDHAKLAAALSSVTGKTYGADDLPFQAIALSPNMRDVSFNVAGHGYECAVSGSSCKQLPDTVTGLTERPAGRRAFFMARGRGPTSSDGKPLDVSPNDQWGVFIRDWNLWVRNMQTGAERQLTTDGVENFGYATDNAGWIHSDRAIVKWSPDSKWIATQQQDDRDVGMMYLVETRVGHPQLLAWKYPLPGDSIVSMIHPVVINVETGTMVRLKMPAEYHRATLEDNINMQDYQWDPDDSHLALVSTSRYHKSATLKVADLATGDVRTVYEETSPTQYESVTGWRVLWPSNEFIWYSERTIWGELYLYDLNTGKLKREITYGEGPVVSIERLDPKTRTIWYGADGRAPGENPYFTHYYRIGLDGGSQVSLTPSVGTHEIQIAPDGRYLVDTYSTPEDPPVVEVRDRDGRLVMRVEQADIGKLLATGWRPPIQVEVKARDDSTDLWGLMWVPTHLDSTAVAKYPIINNGYPGPQSGSVSRWSFTAASGDHQAMAELGFVVVSINGMGTPDRSKSFHDKWYGAMGRDNTLPDQVIGMKELARKYPYIDIDKAGIWGHSGGGFLTADAMFRYPDFFKVGWSESGNHDQREYEDDWGERYQGQLVRTDDTDNYAPEANETIAQNLKGHLMITFGTNDDNVPPYNSLLVIDALIHANKNFDMIALPNEHHGYADDSNYIMRRRWDYFVRYLMGATPPHEYEVKTAASRGR